MADFDPDKFAAQLREDINKDLERKQKEAEAHKKVDANEKLRSDIEKERLEQERKNLGKEHTASKDIKEHLISIFKRPVFLFLLFLVLAFLASGLGYTSIAIYIGIAAVCFLIISVIFKESPHKALVVFILPLSIGILNFLGINTPVFFAGVIGFSTIIILASFEKTRIWSEWILEMFVYIFGAAILFWSSGWVQSQLGFKFPQIITSILIVIYFIWLFFKDMKKFKIFKFCVIGANVLFFLVVYADPYVFGPAGTPFTDTALAQRDAWVNMVSAVGTAGQIVGKEFEKGYLISIGDYEQGVEAKSEKPLGVFLENVGTTSKTVILSKTGSTIVDMFGRLRSEAFGMEKPLSIKVKCYADGLISNTKSTQIKPKSEFDVVEYESQDIDCIFSADEIGAGRAVLVMDISFGFETDSFLKTYFMDQERRRALDRELIPQGKTALDSFGITDKNPVGVFSGGPVKIGMGVSQQPVGIDLSSGGQIAGPVLTLTFDKNWLDGDLVNLTGLKISSPSGVKITDIDGNSVDCNAGAFCEISADVLVKVFGKSISVPKTVRVHTEIVDVNTLLGGSPLGIHSFKVTAFYDYRIKKSVEVNIQGAVA